MAQINCPNCGELTEDNEYLCPNCGCILNDGSKDQHEEWALELLKKDKIKKTIGVVFLSIGLVLGFVFLILWMATSITRVAEDGSSLIEYNPAFVALTFVFFGIFAVGVMICFIYRYTKVMIQTFDGYTVAVKTTLANAIIYVQNKIVLKKTKNYRHDTYKVSLPNNKFVNIVLTEKVCTFELSNE
ncbi:MAG: TFIIB-type zinc ribbon-containing protein [Bacilli bacterium]|nr:TFIIB-type zinc ribbon-containing protein [Bacilli bacterium]